MGIQVTLTLSSDSYQRVEQLARLTKRSVDDVLSDTVEGLLSPLPLTPEISYPVSELSDEHVLQLADLQMDPEEDQRLSSLLQEQQARKLAENEQTELFALMQVYQVGLLRKASALREAVKRGLKEPLAP